MGELEREKPSTQIPKETEKVEKLQNKKEPFWMISGCIILQKEIDG